MSYIGKEPVVGNFQVCDAISVVNGQAAYTMQVSSTNVVPESANHMLVSLNGILQKPNSSFTVSGSTITFASNLATGDVIDFIMLLGNVLDIGTPSDATVTDAKANFVSTSSASGLQIKGDGTTDGTLQLNCSQNSHGIKLASPAHSAGQSYKLIFPTGNVTADKVLKVASVSGSGTTGIGQLSFGDAGGGAFELISTTTVSSGVSTVDFGTLSTDYTDFKVIISGMSADTDNQDFQMLVKKVGDSSFETASSAYYFAGFGYNANNTEKKVYGSGGSGNKITVSCDVMYGGGTGGSGFEIDIYDVHATGHRNFGYIKQAFFEGSDNYVAVGHGAFQVIDNTALQAFQFKMSSGNIDSGYFSLYGRKR